jgi:hypothetical protein
MLNVSLFDTHAPSDSHHPHVPCVSAGESQLVALANVSHVGHTRRNAACSTHRSYRGHHAHGESHWNALNDEQFTSAWATTAAKTTTNAATITPQCFIAFCFCVGAPVGLSRQHHCKKRQ